MTSAPTRLAVGLTFLFAVLAGPVGLARGAVISEDFTDFDGTQWVIGEDSFWNETEGNFYLTPSRMCQQGRLYYATPLTVSSFTASFDYQIFGGDKADGLTFAFVKDPHYSSDYGGALDFTGADGYAVEFDTFRNYAWDPPERHIAFIQNSTSNHLALVKIEVRGSHRVEIRFALGNLAVIFDGSEILTYQIPDFVPFDGYFGFTAATGTYSDNHVIDNVVITTEEECDALTGRVVFEDNSTPVRIPGGPRVRVIAYHRESKERFPVLVDDNSEYQFAPGRLPEGTYDLAAIYNLPSQFVHENYSPIVLQPYDLSANPDFSVDSGGKPSNCNLDIVFPWPAILLHGIISPLDPLIDDNGPNDFETLQPYLCGDAVSLKSNPRWGIISLVPDMGEGNQAAYYNSLLTQIPIILSLFHDETCFNVCAYSQGGLVARMFLQDPIDELTPVRIKKVIQVGTPNTGTCVAKRGNGDIPWLTPKALDKFNARYNNGRGVPFYLLAGTKFFWIPGINDCLIGGEEDDGIVEVSSVFALDSVGNYSISFRETVSSTHNKYLEKQVIMEWVHSVLVN